ncbi:hypothetical protein CP982_07105 [Streptomyces spectabilis]|uniref:Uncharacterized protein n=1 Tax=Streptomyces spectabilis TaxID=68270 RepID=A0A5P2X7W9_STRST|nr:hypothetical protein CP982_07105 [Streptomyces spectabilis]
MPARVRQDRPGRGADLRRPAPRRAVAALRARGPEEHRRLTGGARGVWGAWDTTAVRDRCVAENHSTGRDASAMIVDMFRHAFPTAPTAVAVAAKAAAFPFDGARS